MRRDYIPNPVCGPHCAIYYREKGCHSWTLAPAGTPYDPAESPCFAYLKGEVSRLGYQITYGMRCPTWWLATANRREGLAAADCPVYAKYAEIYRRIREEVAIPADDELLDVVRSLGEPSLCSKIGNVAGLSNGEAYRRLQRLLQAGLVKVETVPGTQRKDGSATVMHLYSAR